jgi:hypothetical protein
MPSDGAVCRGATVEQGFMPCTLPQTHSIRTSDLQLHSSTGMNLSSRYEGSDDVAMALVAIERFEIDLVQNDSQEIFVDVAGSIESALRDVDLCLSPFDNKHEDIKEMCARANVHRRSDRREINDHVLVAIT